MDSRINHIIQKKINKNKMSKNKTLYFYNDQELRSLTIIRDMEFL